MKLQSKYADLVLNLLVAVAISLVVNFSYVLLMLVDLNSDSQMCIRDSLRAGRRHHRS